MKPLAVIFLLMTLLLFMTGCGSSSQKEGNTKSADKESPDRGESNPFTLISTQDTIPIYDKEGNYQKDTMVTSKIKISGKENKIDTDEADIVETGSTEQKTGAWIEMDQSSGPLYKRTYKNGKVNNERQVSKKKYYRALQPYELDEPVEFTLIAQKDTVEIYDSQGNYKQDTVVTQNLKVAENLKADQFGEIVTQGTTRVRKGKWIEKDAKGNAEKRQYIRGRLYNQEEL